MTIENIITDYGKMVSSICRRMIRDEETARDAAQEVWLEIIKSLPTYRGEAKLSTWVYTVASRVVIKYAQKEKIYSTRFLRSFFHGVEIEPPVRYDFEKQLWVREMCDKCLTGILHCLDNESRLTYVFRDIAEIPYGEIALILNKEEPAVRKIISRARKKLRNFLQNECILCNGGIKSACRMSRWASEIDLPKEYAKLRETINRINIYRASETVLPGKNYWEKYI